MSEGQPLPDPNGGDKEVNTATEVRRFYRIVEADPPTVNDFVSHRIKKGPPRPNLPAELLRLWDGLSVYDSEDEARRRARRLPRLGTSIAELRITSSDPIEIEQTTRDRHHFTLWGDAEHIRRLVVRVVEV